MIEQPKDYAAIHEPWDVQEARSKRSHTRFYIAAGLAIAGLGYLLWTGEGQAHDAPPSKMQPLGWQYGVECCSAVDCRQVEPAAVAETPKGYMIKLTGEIVPYGDKRLKRSKDEYYHQCTLGGNPKAPHSICLYTPDRSF